MPTTILTDLAVDPPLVQDASYRFDSEERKYIDDQIRGVSQHLVDALIRGRHGTYVKIASTSPTLVSGDCVCLASVDEGEPRVIKGTLDPLEDAIAAFGVIVLGASPGSFVLIAHGGVLPNTITGLAKNNPGFVRVNTTTARCERVSALDIGDYGIGVVSRNGDMLVIPGIGSANTVSPGGGSGPAAPPNSLQKSNNAGDDFDTFGWTNPDGTTDVVAPLGASQFGKKSNGTDNLCVWTTLDGGPGSDSGRNHLYFGTDGGVIDASWLSAWSTHALSLFVGDTGEAGLSIIGTLVGAGAPIGIKGVRIKPNVHIGQAAITPTINTWGAGSGVLRIDQAATVPTTTPTDIGAASAILYYVDTANTFKLRHTSGSAIRTLSPYLGFGADSAVAATGDIRLPRGTASDSVPTWSMRMRDQGDANDLGLIDVYRSVSGSANSYMIGRTDAISGSYQPSKTFHFGTIAARSYLWNVLTSDTPGSVVGATVLGRYTDNANRGHFLTNQLTLVNASASFPTLAQSGGGEGTFFFGAVGTAPTGNPTGGVAMWVDPTTFCIKYRKPDGTIVDTCAAGSSSDTASNLGVTGSRIFSAKVGADFQFRRLLAGAGVTLTEHTNDVQIDTIGEANTGSNLGTGSSVFKAKVAVDFQFRKINAGTNITVTQNADDITISAAGSVGEANTGSNVGTGDGLVFKQKTGIDFEFKTLKDGAYINVADGTDDITFDFKPWGVNKALWSDGSNAFQLGTLPYTVGGTGLSALGTALQVLRTDAGATGMEWATITSASPAGNNDEIQTKNGTAFNAATGVKGFTNVITIGSSPAAGGSGIRLSNTYGLYARNGAGSGDIRIAETDGSNNLRTGLGASALVFDSTSQVGWQVAGGAYGFLANAGDTFELSLLLKGSTTNSKPLQFEKASFSVSATPHNLTAAQYSNVLLQISSSVGSAVDLNFPAIPGGFWIVTNTDATDTLRCGVSGGTRYSVSAGQTGVFTCNGTNLVPVSAPVAF